MGGIKAGEKTVRLLMRDMGIKSIRQEAKSLYDKEKKRNRNLLQQQFNPLRPNQVWVSDITMFRLKEKNFYICVILDLFSRAVVGYKIGIKNSTQLTKKLDEVQFKKKLRNALKHAVNRNGWKYIGVWERSPEKQRLHFHGIFYIPQMIGEIVEVKDYSTKSHRMQTTYQNTHFLKEFGRNDFKAIDIPNDISQSVKYLLKYIEKSGEKLVYGGKLPTYFKSDILDEDIACGFGVDEKKLLLFDNFECIDEGVLMGKVSPEVIEQMPKAN